MTGYLLDTSTAVRSLANSSSLSEPVRAAVGTGPNFLSVISYWEVMLKSMKGNLDVGDPQAWWLDALDELAARPLLLRLSHVAGVYHLPPHHKDPFDRILVAQAIAEDLTLVTTDGEIPLYTSAGLMFIA